MHDINIAHRVPKRRKDCGPPAIICKFDQKNRERHEGGSSKPKVFEKHHADQSWIKPICNNQECYDL